MNVEEALFRVRLNRFGNASGSESARQPSIREGEAGFRKPGALFYCRMDRRYAATFLLCSSIVWAKR